MLFDDLEGWGREGGEWRERKGLYTHICMHVCVYMYICIIVR